MKLENIIFILDSLFKNNTLEFENIKLWNKYDLDIIDMEHFLMNLDFQV